MTKRKTNKKSKKEHKVKRILKNFNDLYLILRDEFDNLDAKKDVDVDELITSLFKIEHTANELQQVAERKKKEFEKNRKTNK